MLDLLVQLAAWSMLGLGAVLFLAQTLAREIGHAFGRRRAREAEAEGAGVTVLVGALLALLAFVLALTLSFSNTRFTERRLGTLNEANAIGTAWLRAQAIDHPRAVEIARLLEPYAELRAEFVRAPARDPAIGALHARTAEQQAQIWGHLAALVRERPDPVTTSLMAALNEAFDAAMAERFAFSFPTPPGLVGLLLTLALMGMAGIGYQLGLRNRPHRVLALLLTAAWTFVIVEILDLGAPRVGALRTSAAVYEWTVEGFRGGLAIPPLNPP
jgi:hypothetical protein